jgi:hypothetical protein
MLGWIKYLVVTHWLQFCLLAATWLCGFVIHAHLKSPLLVLYYAGHVAAASALFGVGMYYLHPGNKDAPPRLHSADTKDVTSAIHRIFFQVLRIMPFTGVLVFLVPDSGLKLGREDSFWLTHVYNDNFAHMVHGILFYLIIVLGVFNFLTVMSRRAKGR